MRFYFFSSNILALNLILSFINAPSDDICSILVNVVRTVSPIADGIISLPLI